MKRVGFFGVSITVFMAILLFWIIDKTMKKNAAKPPTPKPEQTLPEKVANIWGNIFHSTPSSYQWWEDKYGPVYMGNPPDAGPYPENSWKSWRIWSWTGIRWN